MRILFVCSRNRLRSPTAERIFSGHCGCETASAGLAPDAETPLDTETLDWVDVVFVMEKRHQKKLKERFSRSLRDKRVLCLGMPDDFERMDLKLVSFLARRFRGCWKRHIEDRFDLASTPWTSHSLSV